ncbi:MFS transporter [Pseudonocardia kunmingensis]|uniref:Putative proline/betaine transporter n=1 Tax=Pseudonocardia kunmingensis TaxID=630975 RepID=A0A543DQ26_9PSEU|nr:MFS transporter [Pseudonocardia kunmingensis]TQM11441.1 sugar phosphate permease [Pseudonocardia kunmingensis]
MSAPPVPPHRQSKRASLAALIGTVLEWYDFIVYGTAAAIILNTLFFPSDDPLVGTLAAFATYAVGFLARPLGGLVLGRLGDRVGRRSVLVLTLFLMGAATTAIGLLPTYEQVGVLAPILLVLLRLVQGFGAGGEYAGAVVLSVEHADPRRRGLAGSAAPLGFAVATLLGNGVFFLFLLLPPEQFASWGWRVPFLLGAVCVLVGYVIRRRVEEPPAFTQAKAEGVAGAPAPGGVFAAIRRHPRSFLIVIGSRMGENGFAYLLPVFGVAYVSTTLGLGRAVALWAVMAASAVQVLAIPLCGLLSDHVGRKPVYAAGTLASLLWLVPFFLLTDTGVTAWVVLAFVVGLGICYPAMLAPQAAWYAELFDTEFRLSGFAFSRELGSLLAGGLAPFVATALYAWSGHWWPILVFMAVLAVLTLVALALGPETVRRDLDGAAQREDRGALTRAVNHSAP